MELLDLSIGKTKIGFRSYLREIERAQPGEGSNVLCEHPALGDQSRNQADYEKRNEELP
jgi:hypothetical protein